MGRAKGRLEEEGDDSLDNMENDRHQMLYLVLIALSEKIEDSSTCFQLELHLLITCDEHEMNGHHRCGGHIREFYSQRGRHLTGASLSGGARTIES